MLTNRSTGTALFLSLVALQAPAVRADHREPPPFVPPGLEVPADQKLVLDAIGKGVQIYECRGNVPTFPTSAAWAFVSPDATLYDGEDIDEVVGTHFIGPTWKANDLSTVVAGVLTRYTPPDPNAIQWLKLGATSHTGDGIFSRVTFIQRLDTLGGTAPAACACDLSKIGMIAKVPYEAHYYFYVPHDHRN